MYKDFQEFLTNELEEINSAGLYKRESHYDGPTGLYQG